MANFPHSSEQFTSFGEGHLPGLLGIRILDISDAGAVAELDVRAELLAPNGYLHGGTVVALADTVAGYACIAALPPGAIGFTTSELKINFLSTARDGAVRATATPLHKGSATQVWDVEVTRAADSKRIAMFRCTQFILYPRPE